MQNDTENEIGQSFPFVWKRETLAAVHSIHDYYTGFGQISWDMGFVKYHLFLIIIIQCKGSLQSQNVNS